MTSNYRQLSHINVKKKEIGKKIKQNHNPYLYKQNVIFRERRKREEESLFIVFSRKEQKIPDKKILEDHIREGSPI